MSDTLTTQEMLSIRNKAFADLKKRYQDPLFDLIDSIDKVIGAAVVPSTPAIPKVKAKTPASSSNNTERLVQAGIDYFLAMGNIEIEAKDIGIFIGGSPKSIGAVFANRQEIFQMIVPSSKRFPSKWKLKDEVYQRFIAQKNSAPVVGADGSVATLPNFHINEGSGG